MEDYGFDLYEQLSVSQSVVFVNTTAGIEAVRAATELARQTRRAVQYLKDEADELVDTIRQAADQAIAVTDDLAGLVGELDQTSATVMKAMANTKASAEKAAEAQKGAASGPASDDLDAWQAHVDALHELLTETIGALEAVVESDTLCREAIEEMRRAAEAEAKRAEEEARKAAEAEQEAESKQKAQEAEDRDATRRARLEERRSRFQRRRKEGLKAEPSKGTLTPEDDSNELAPSTPRKRGDRPRRTGRRRPRDRSSEDGEDAPKRQVRSWTPGGSGTTKATGAPSRARRSRPRGDHPTGKKTEESSGADKLLERLRKRKAEDGE